MQVVAGCQSRFALNKLVALTTNPEFMNTSLYLKGNTNNTVITDEDEIENVE
jgi:hypothetical protein